MSITELHTMQILGWTPWLLVVLGGILWCMLNASRAPKVSLVVGIALVLQLISLFLLPLLMSHLARFLGLGANAVRLRIFVDSLVYSIPRSISLGILLWAAFSSVGRVPSQDRVTESAAKGS